MKYQNITLPDDLSAVKNVAISSFSSTPDSSLDQWFSFSEMEQMISRGGGMCIKAIDDKDEIVGMIYAQQENPINGEEGTEKWVIVMTAVNKNSTGSGIGSGLLNAIEKYAKEKGAKKIFVYTNENDSKVIDFYEKNNYEGAGRIKDYQYGKDNSVVFLLKYL